MPSFRSISIRMWFAFVLIVLAFCYVAAMMYHVQINRHEELYSKAKRKYTAIRKTAGHRGEIFDCNGYLLVGNIPCTDVCADPSLCGDETQCREKASVLAPHLGIPESELYRKMMDKFILSKDNNGKEQRRDRKFVILKNAVDFETGEKLRTLTTEKKWKGIFYRETAKRIYPKKQLLANILGFTTSDRDSMIAVIGLEKFFDKRMRSVEGKTVYERTRTGVPISFGNSDEEQEVRDGLNIYLTINEPIQAILEEELDRMVEKHAPRICYAVMADPWTGNIIAAAQRPTFDPNDRSKVTPDAWRNRIAEDTFEPGSTMKPIAISGAIDRGVVTPDTKFDCEGGRWVYAGKSLKDSHKIGVISVSEIIKQSSNVGTAKIALAMGEDLLDETLRSFGIGQSTGIPLKPETKGIYRKRERWDALSITRFPIGQGVAVSPLQLVRAYCMLANGGHPVNLNLVSKIENPATGKVEIMQAKREPSVYQNPTTHEKMVMMMKRVTEKGGTGHIAAIPGYYVAGKTGTAQKYINGSYSKSKYIANYIGFVPADHPRFVLLVTADEPQHGYYGGTVSGPFFKAIAERTLKFMEVPMDYVPETPKKK